MKRVQRCVRHACLIVMIVGPAFSLVVNVFAYQFIGLYGPSSDLVIAYAVERLRVITIPYFLCGIMEILTGTLRGMGRSFGPMLINFVTTCLMRIFWVLVIFPIDAMHTLTGLYTVYIVSWATTIVAQYVYYRFAVQSVNKRLMSSAMAEALPEKENKSAINV